MVIAKCTMFAPVSMQTCINCIYYMLLSAIILIHAHYAQNCGQHNRQHFAAEVHMDPLNINLKDL